MARNLVEKREAVEYVGQAAADARMWDPLTQ